MIIKGIDKHFSDLASLHYFTINQGFLVKLGPKFLRILYKYLIKEEIVFVSIELGKVNGFVSCSLNSKGIIKRFIFKRPVALFHLLISILKNPKLLKSIIETYKAPSMSLAKNQSFKAIPEIELLSICVEPNTQGSGIGLKLLIALENELKIKGVDRYKVIAGDKLQIANNFYKKNGFKMVKQIRIHGNDLSNVYVKNIH